ncbi:MAG: BspA family leucine-rich repeat surface protein [Saprospiraceae bacterium]|nr:BspA family leucine-rich repeat surface protein [Saprospiraceae bacterium]
MKNLFYAFKSSGNHLFLLTGKNSMVYCLFLCLLATPIYNQAFITTWQTSFPGSSGPTSISIPTHPGYEYDYDVDWNNDGSYEDLNITGDITHDYRKTGVFTIRIRGKFPAIFFNNSGDKQKILSIEQWGYIEWATMTNAFYGASNLRLIAHDSPDLSRVSSLINMFREATSLNSDLSLWDVSNIITMQGMLTNTGLSISNYDKTLIGWASQGITGLELGAHNLLFCQGDAARNYLVSNLGWNIQGDSYDCSSLPIILLTFSTRLTKDDEVLLKWETASEVNNMGFEVKRSSDCKCWDVIGYVEGYGTKDLNSHYTLVDENPSPGVNYYVLRQIDRNGDDTYSDIRSVHVVMDDQIKIYPNPTGGILQVMGKDINEITVFDRTGHHVKNCKLTDSYIDISELPVGIYIIAIHTSHMVLYKRIVKN